MRGAVRILLVTALLGTGAGARAGDETPTLARALLVEKTSREPEKALPIYAAVAADPATTPSDRAQARFGLARCHDAAGRTADALAALGAIVDDPDSPTSDRDDARARREALRAAASAEGDRDAAARAAEAMRRAEAAAQEREGRLKAGKALVEAAVAHVKAKRDDDARRCLLEALERNPGDERALALLEEVGGRTDRGNLLKQAIRFVASNRVADLARLTSTVEVLRRAGRRALTEGRPAEAAATLRDAVGKIDESDFFDELAATRKELVLWFAKALDEAKAKGVPLDEGLRVPAALPRPEGEAPVRPWRAEFFALLGRIFTSREDGSAPVRIYDAAVPFDASPDGTGTRFSGGGIASTVGPGALRRARFLERHLRREVSPGSWSGTDRLLDRYEDLVIVQHGLGVLKAADALVAAFPTSPAPPLLVDVRVYAAAPGGLEEATRALAAVAAQNDEGASAVVGSLALAEQETLLGACERVAPLARASLRLAGRRSATVRFRERTAAAPPYADEGAPRVVIPDRDATYGLDVELYGEDLVPAGKKDAAVSVVARVRRLDRPRLVPLTSGWVRAPVFLEQETAVDRRLPHGASIVLYGLSNPFRANGYAGDPSGGTHPDLLVLVSARPSGEGGTPDVVAPPKAIPAPGARTPLPTEVTTTDHDLGAIGHDLADEPPPEDWPRTPFGSARFVPGRGSRDAFLAGWVADQARIPADEGPVVAHDGRLSATGSAGTQGRVAGAVEALLAPGGAVVRIEVATVELPGDQIARLLADAKVKEESPGQRVFRLDAKTAATLDERLVASGGSAGRYDFTTRIAALHTQLVTARAVRVRAVVEEIRAERRPDGRTSIVPVNGTVEEGVVVAVRPVVLGVGVVAVYASAILADVEKTDEWRPEGLPDSAPTVALPRHRVERAAASGAIAEGETLLFVVPTPGTDGARAVAIRIRLPR